MKEKVSIEYDDEKLRALDMVLKKEHSSVQQHLSKTLDELYMKRVPEPIREFIESKTAAKPKRQARSLNRQADGPGNQNSEDVKHEQ